MSFQPSKYPMTIWKGGTFRSILTLYTGNSAQSATWDLTNYIGECRIFDSAGNLLEDLTTDNGGVILGDIEGTISVVIAASVTANLSWTTAKYELDITAPSGGDTYPLLYGDVTVKSSLT